MSKDIETFDFYTVLTEAAKGVKSKNNIPPIEVLPIEGDCGFAICLGESDELRVDVFPPGTDDEVPGAYISMCDPTMTPAQARQFAVLLFAAANYADRLNSQ